MIGIKLAASRRASDPLLDPICELARERGVPVLHHVWQHRRRDWPGQEASDAVRSEEHTSELQSHSDLVCRLLLEKKKKYQLSPLPHFAREATATVVPYYIRS